MSLPFTDEQLQIMEGKYAALGRKYGVSTTYVKMIAKGERESNSKLSKIILSDISDIIEFFKPIPE